MRRIVIINLGEMEGLDFMQCRYRDIGFGSENFYLK